MIENPKYVEKESVFKSHTIVVNITGGDFPEWGASAFTQGGAAKRQILFPSWMSKLTITSNNFNCIIIIKIIIIIVLVNSYTG